MIRRAINWFMRKIGYEPIERDRWMIVTTEPLDDTEYSVGLIVRRVGGVDKRVGISHHPDLVGATFTWDRGDGKLIRLPTSNSPIACCRWVTCRPSSMSHAR